MMAEGKITIEKQGHLMLIGIDRMTKLNSFTPQMYTVLKSSRMSQLEGTETAVSQLHTLQQKLLKTEDVQEGVRAFIERRPAQFKGK